MESPDMRNEVASVEESRHRRLFLPPGDGITSRELEHDWFETSTRTSRDESYTARDPWSGEDPETPGRSTDDAEMQDVGDAVQRSSPIDYAGHSLSSEDVRHQFSPSSRRILRACDFCFTSKAKCDKRQPCERCQARGRDCTYDRLGKGTPATTSNPGSPAQHSAETNFDSYAGQQQQQQQPQSQRAPSDLGPHPSLHRFSRSDSMLAAHGSPGHRGGYTDYWSRSARWPNSGSRQESDQHQDAFTSSMTIVPERTAAPQQYPPSELPFSGESKIRLPPLARLSELPKPMSPYHKYGSLEMLNAQLRDVWGSPPMGETRLPGDASSSPGRPIAFNPNPEPIEPSGVHSTPFGPTSNTDALPALQPLPWAPYARSYQDLLRENRDLRLEISGLHSLLESARERIRVLELESKGAIAPCSNGPGGP